MELVELYIVERRKKLKDISFENESFVSYVLEQTRQAMAKETERRIFDDLRGTAGWPSSNEPRIPIEEEMPRAAARQQQAPFIRLHTSDAFNAFWSGER